MPKPPVQVGEDPDPTEFLFVSLEQKRIDQSKPYDSKKACWVPEEKEGYVLGEIKATKGELVTVALPGGEEKNFKKEQLSQVNPPKFEKVEDMADLTYLNEAAVLHNLRQRYYSKLIYHIHFDANFPNNITFPIPKYHLLKMLNARIKNVHNTTAAKEAHHLFLISEEARKLIPLLETGTRPSKILQPSVSVSCCDGHLVDCSRSTMRSASAQVAAVQSKEWNQLAHGERVAVKNHNESNAFFLTFEELTLLSSRISDYPTITQGKTRIPGVNDAEEFEQLDVSWANFNAKLFHTEMCFLSNDIYDYNSVSQGKITIPNVDDGEECLLTDEAFNVLGFTQEEKDNIYRITSAVMHMGRMQFKQKGREEQAEADGTEDGDRVAKLLGVGTDDLYKNLLKPRIKVGNEFVTKGQNKDQVTNSVVALYCTGYLDQFPAWENPSIEQYLFFSQLRSQTLADKKIWNFLTSFGNNGFNQLCINFTNERLQQFFNHYMFILEQEEYEREGIQWTFIDFGLDLQPTIDLIEKPMGILSILEEESMFPKATDQTFAEKLMTNHLGKSAPFMKPRPPKPGIPAGHFAIGHYAGVVSYNITGWLEKNKDPLNDTVVDQFKKGSNALMVEIFADHPGQSADPAAAKGGRGKKGAGFATVSSSYKEQLNNLMTTLKSTQPHFVRCIIPNEMKTAGVVDAHLVMHQLTCNGVLEGIRICRKGFPNRMMYPDFKLRYKILCPQLIKEPCSPEKVTQIVLTHIQLPEEQFRMGKTKVFFRAGVLGQMEEFRDERLSKIMSWMQAWCRGYLSRKEFKKMQEQRVSLEIVQRNLRKYLKLRTWAWWKLWQKVKPLLNVSRVEDQIAKLEEKATKAQEAYEKEEKLRKELEALNSKLLAEKTALLDSLSGEKGALQEYQEKAAKLTAQKNDLENQLRDTQERLAQEEDARNQLFQTKKKLEQEIGSQKKDAEDLELQIQKIEQDKASKDHQIRNLNDEIAHQDELINKLNKEKKMQGEVNQKTAEELQAAEDKVNHLNKVKAKLEQTLDELEDSLEREKKLRGDVEKAKRKVEGDLKLTQEAVADLERNKKELEQTVLRKDKEISALSAKLEDEQSLVGKLQKQIKELQARIEELEEEVEAERQARAKAEKQRADLARELEELGERLEEAGGATSAQIELNKKREAELAKLRRDLEEANIQHEGTLANLRKKHNDAVAEMAEQVDQLNKLKTKAEKERTQYFAELNDARIGCDQLSNEKAAQEKIAKQLQHTLNEVQSKLDETNRTLNDFDASKKKLSIENSDLLRQLEDAESQVSQLSKIKISLTQQLEDTKRLADEEARERATLLGKFRNLEHDLDNLREQVEEEAEGKGDIQRQLSKANAEAQLWRSKYESEGVARAEELEEAKRKLQARLAEAEETIESLNQKCIALEKTKQRLATEVEDLQLEVDRASSIANAAEKKQKAFDKIIGEWKLKVDDLAAELDASQKECRNYSTELFRLKGAYEEGQEQLEAVRRENKNLADEVKDLLDQIGEGGRNIHEIEKSRKRLEAEKDELQAALEEAEAALEQEENKVLRAQLELSQVRQEIDRRIQEKEEEFENTRKNHQRALDSMQASLEAEAKGKAEALRMKKKLEADINELEIALDHANKANAEAQKNIKRYQQQLKDVQSALEEEQRARDDAREQLGISERRANALQNELEESRTLLEQADRGRRQAEQELSDAHEQLNEVSAQNASIAAAKRKLESELQTLHSDLDELLNEAKNSEEKAKKAMVDAARLADELRAEQDHAQTQEKLRKALEQQIKELQVRLDEAESNALKGGKKAIQKLEQRVRELESELDSEQRRHADAQKNLRKSERRIKELTFQSEEDRKNHERMQDLVDKLQQKIKTYKRQIEEAEEIAALNLAKFRKAQQELEEAEERADIAEQAATKFRTKGGRAGSVQRGASPAPQRQPSAMPALAGLNLPTFDDHGF
ncbi:AGAP010147-PA [Anopheles gambiae str. PEST]|uniref:AGAP010147-PA n=1 Tax=Anopheles gambiae TaxID=7165 RepID=Q7PJV2_ANOGA|nr:AGAP010147-PA [Anopheles gambiae str. PEST]